MDNQQFKVCTECGKDLPLSSFYKQKRETKTKGIFYVYKSECKECTKSKSQKWTENNRDKHRTYVKKYYKTDKGRENLERKKDSTAERRKRFRNNNPEYMRVHNQNRYANKNNLQADFTVEEWSNCLDYFDHCCAYCGISEEELHSKGEVLEQEHVIPVSKDGGYTKSNILPSCHSCNMSKYTNDFEEWYLNYEMYSEEREQNIVNYFLSIEDEHLLLLDNINCDSIEELSI